MNSPRLAAASPSDSNELRWRHRFSILTVVTTVALIAWGGFVTSINAGLAVPDWPTSFNSYDPFNPWPQWWTVVPVLAEHGHRLLGALTGLFTLVLAVWTWRADPRRWMRLLGFAALALVIAQGVLGGLRVVWVSLDLAVVHACVAQIFFSLMVAMTLFTSRGWLSSDSVPPPGRPVTLLRRMSVLSVLALYGQIILGALLRHPGTGIDAWLAALHIGGAFVAFGFVVATFFLIRLAFSGLRMVARAGWFLFAVLVMQVLLGLTAYFVTLDEAGVLQPSNVQVLVNTSHLVVGALLLASAVVVALLAFRRPAPAAPPAAPETPAARARVAPQPVA